MTMTKIGDMRERVRFVRLSKTRRADGGYDTTNATLHECWAKVVPQQGNETDQGGRKRGAMTYKLDMYRYDGATTEDTLIWLTRGSAMLNVREIRREPTRPLLMTVIAESGVVL